MPQISGEGVGNRGCSDKKHAGRVIIACLTTAPLTDCWLCLHMTHARWGVTSPAHGPALWWTAIDREGMRRDLKSDAGCIFRFGFSLQST
jgi:hypothetical protein